tara:strand:- start:1037 stop:1762 length:726 start_codon:yes stop_codon:yes gene_type:complete
MKTKSINTCLFGLFLTLFFSSCSYLSNCVEGEGMVVEKEIQLENFQNLLLSNNVQVELSQGAVQVVRMEANENFFDLLNTEVVNGEWDVRFEQCVKKSGDIKLFIQVPTIAAINIKGSGDVKSIGKLNLDNLHLKINGSGDIDLELEANQIETSINGSGNIQLLGSANDHTIKINGSGDLKAGKFLTVNTVIKTNGSGDAKLFASESLEIKINGSGDIDYSGNPKTMNSKINGSGKISQSN